MNHYRTAKDRIEFSTDTYGLRGPERADLVLLLTSGFLPLRKRRITKMRLTIVLFSVFAFFSVASATVFNISVGANGQYAYDPQFLMGVVAGDALRFQFKTSTSHSVTESTYDQPCASKSGGLDSGVRSNANANVTDFEVTVGSNAQIWFHCVIGTHCSSSGMVFALNPTPDKNFETFRARAMGQLKGGAEVISVQKAAVALAIVACALNFFLW